MRPESGQKAEADSPQKFLELGVPEEWIEPLMALGYDSVKKLKEVEKPGKLHQEIMGYRKKNKLDIETVTLEQVAEWIS